MKSPDAIYITGLPTTIGQIQVEDICKGLGRIKKIKVYRDGGGVPKGDATVVFESKKSRRMSTHAVGALDGKRIDQGGLGSYVISVQEATFKPSTTQQQHRQRVREVSSSPSAPEQPPATSSVAPPDAPKVLLMNLCGGQQTPEQRKSLEDEVGAECTKYGRVLDAEFVETDHAVLVTFASLDAAKMCETAMHGRYFDERVIRAEVWPEGEKKTAAVKTNKATDYVGAPPPKIVDGPPIKAPVDPDQPTARMRNIDPVSSPPAVAMMKFVPASSPPSTDEVVDTPPPEKVVARPTSRKRTAADFFDDD